MEEYIELKLASDDFGIAVNGLTMTESQSTKELKLIEETDTKKIFANKKGCKAILHRCKSADTIEYYTTFCNESSEPVVLEMISSVALSGIACDRIYRLQSFWSAEGKLKIDTVSDLHLEQSWSGHSTRNEKFGSIGSYPVRKYFPFLALENSRTGEFVGVQLYLPSSWQMEISCNSEQVRINGGLADYDFGHWRKIVNPKETFTTPKAKVATGKSLYEICDKLVKAQKPDISVIDEDLPVIFNEWCTTWGNPTFDNVKKICEILKGKGIRYFVVDAGWYGDSCEWNVGMGNWEVNSRKIPEGLKALADCIRENGMIPGIWFEFEVVGRAAAQFRMEDHLLKRNGIPITTGDRRFWDMEDQWVEDFLSERVIQTLKTCGFGYIKVDYNDNIGIGCDGYESLGEGLRKKLLATQSFFRKIKKEIPNIVIENCASGGNRLEPSMMELVSQASFSDAHETLAIPVIAANLHRAVRPEQSQIWAVLRKEYREDRLYYLLCASFLGRMCLSGEILDLEQWQWEIVDDAIEMYRDIVQILKNGYTNCIDCSAESYLHPEGQQLVTRVWKDEMLAVYHRFEASLPFDDCILEGYETIKCFGKADKDFSAVVYWAKKISM